MTEVVDCYKNINTYYTQHGHIISKVYKSNNMFTEDSIVTLDDLYEIFKSNEQIGVMEVEYVIEYVVNKSSRGLGYGRKELVEWCNTRGSRLIVADAGVIEGVCSVEDIKREVEGLKRFYEKAGFVDVDKFIGQHSDYMCALIYNNKEYKKIEKYLRRNTGE